MIGRFTFSLFQLLDQLQHLQNNAAGLVAHPLFLEATNYQQELISMTTKTSSTTTADGPFGSSAARQSSRVGVTPGTSDGAVWQEKLTVCEGTTTTGQPQVFVRSYYRNLETLEKAWDEPPSGASAILHATAAERQEFETQRTQLELTLQSIPDEDDIEEAANRNKAKKGFFGRFRKKNSEVDASKDVHLQKAIARSIREQKGDASALDDDVELAMALSMSVHDNNHEDSEQAMFERALARSQRERTNRNTEEDRALQEALERSKYEQLQESTYESPLESLAPVAAALPTNDLLRDYSSSSNMDPPLKFSEDEMDLKMPAKPQFDPYGKK